MKLLLGHLLAIFAAALSVSACSSGTASVVGAPAVWELDGGQNLGDSSTAFTAMVTRLNCNGGVTGDVAAPDVKFTAAQVIVTFKVTPEDPEAANCPGNKPVRYDVKLGTSLDGRELIDGNCLPGGPAESTTLCSASRWRP